jgi:hypothetical protein
MTELRELCLHAPPSLTSPAMPSLPSTFKAVKDAKAVQIDSKELAKTVQMGASLSPKYKGELVDFLQGNKDFLCVVRQKC